MDLQLKGSLSFCLRKNNLLRGGVLQSSSRSTRGSLARGRRNSLTPLYFLEFNKSKGSAKSSHVDASTAEDEIKRELHYRLSAKEADAQNLYKSVAWSVHNRLLDSFEKTHEHWK